MKKILILIFTCAVVVLFTGYVFFAPPVIETIELDPQKYQITNRYVTVLRRTLVENGKLNSNFWPTLKDTGQILHYMYWYKCAFFGEPNYAITVTIQYPEEDLEAECARLASLRGSLIEKKADCVFMDNNSLSEIHNFLEPPVLDGRVYNMEYVIISKADRRITYTELHIVEGQKCHDEIISQMLFLLKEA